MSSSVALRAWRWTRLLAAAVGALSARGPFTDVHSSLMNLRYILPSRIFIVIILLRTVGANAAELEPFVRPLQDADAVKKIWGDVRSYPEPRGLMGRDESHAAHRRGSSVGAFSNAIFDV